MNEGIYTALEEIVGPENVWREPAVLDSYVWQSLPGEDADIWLKRPAAVVLPGSVNEVRAVVKLCGESGVAYTSYATGWGAFGAPMSERTVQLDLNRLNRIVSVDPAKREAEVEPGVCAAELQAEALKLGLDVPMPHDGPCGSLLPGASAGEAGEDGGAGEGAPGSAPELLEVEYVAPGGELERTTDPRSVPAGAVVTLGKLRLNEWPGPPGIELKGLLFDAEVRVPDSLRFYLCFFPDPEAEARAADELESAHVGYMSNYASFGSMVYCLAPNLFGRVTGTEALGGLLRKVLGNSCVIMLADPDPGELDRRERSLEEIVERAGGFALSAREAPRLASLLFACHYRSAVVPRAGRGWGTPRTFLEKLEV